MKARYCFGIVYLVLLLLSFSSVNSFEVQTINGSLMDWDSSFCLEDPANYYDLVGDDYYVYCEGDFSAEYNQMSDNFTPVEDIIVPTNTSKDIIDTPETQNNTSYLNKDSDVILDDGQNIQTNNWSLFASIAGIIMLFIIVILIIAHRLAIKRDEKKQIINLTPYINTLRKKGYGENQLEELLINRGYESSFINKLLNKK